MSSCQTTICSYFGSSPTFAQPERVEPYRKTFEAKIYVYLKDGIVIYVGQTYQTLRARDNAHLWSSTGTFDKQYTNKGMFTLKLLESKPFSEMISTNKELAKLLTKTCAWMDDRERHYIDEYNTFCGAGLNSTTGGQKGCTVALYEARLKKAEKYFQTVLMPALCKYFQEQI